MEKKEVIDFIIEYIYENMGVELSDDIKMSKDSLLNPQFGINPRDLFMLVMELQNEFSVSLCEEDVMNKRLDYIENLAEWIYQR